MFRLKGLSIAEKKKNWISLITAQLNFASLADMSGLEADIKEFSARIANLEVNDSDQDKQIKERIRLMFLFLRVMNILMTVIYGHQK